MNRALAIATVPLLILGTPLAIYLSYCWRRSSWGPELFVFSCFPFVLLSAAFILGRGAVSRGCTLGALISALSIAFCGYYLASHAARHPLNLAAVSLIVRIAQWTVAVIAFIVAAVDRTGGVRRLHTMKPLPLILSAILFVIGAGGVFAFLTVNFSDSVPSDVISRFGWLVLSPCALLFSIRLRLMCWLGAVSMLAGVFLGVCVRCLIPPHQSNIWPIAAFIWTALFVLPVVTGAAIGGLAGWLIKRFRRDSAASHTL